MQENNTYKINGVSFKLKPFERYSKNQELKIKQLLGLNDEDNTINVSTNDNNEIFPLLLIAEDEAVDITNLDFNDAEDAVITEIMLDWIVERVFFIQNREKYLAGLVEKKIQQRLIMNEGLAKAEPSNQK